MPLRIVHERNDNNGVKFCIAEQTPHWRTLKATWHSVNIKLPYTQYYYIGGLSNSVHGDRWESLGISNSLRPLQHVNDDTTKLMFPLLSDLCSGWGPHGNYHHHSSHKEMYAGGVYDRGAWACLPFDKYDEEVNDPKPMNSCIEWFWNSNFRFPDTLTYIEGSFEGTFPGVNRLAKKFITAEQLYEDVYTIDVYKKNPDIGVSDLECSNLQRYNILMEDYSKSDSWQSLK